MFKLIDYDSGDSSLVDLGQLTNLRHLRIDEIWLEDTGAGPIDILSRITSFDLETIHLRFGFESVVDHAAMEEWNQFAQGLTRPQFVKLQKVRIDVLCYVGDYPGACRCTDWANLMYQQMSILGEILDVSVFHETSW